MEMELMVSVDMITYKHEKFIAQAIEGVLMQQTDFDFELVICDDCSPDGTEQIVKDLISSHPKGHIIKYFRHSENRGMQANGDFAIKQCHGKYIALCEGDDYWTDPLKLQKQVDFLDANPAFSICFHAVVEVSENSSHHQIVKTLPAETEFTIEDLAKGNFIHTPSVIFKNNMKELPAWFNCSPIGDYPLHLLNAQFGKIKYFPQKMAAYRVGSGLWSNLQVSERIINTLFTLKLLKTYFTEVNKPVADLLQEQHLYLMKKLQNIDDKDKIITSFLSDLKQVELRLTIMDLIKIIRTKIKRTIKSKF